MENPITAFPKQTDGVANKTNNEAGAFPSALFVKTGIASIGALTGLSTSIDGIQQTYKFQLMQLNNMQLDFMQMLSLQLRDGNAAIRASVRGATGIGITQFQRQQALLEMGNMVSRRVTRDAMIRRDELDRMRRQARQTSVLDTVLGLAGTAVKAFFGA